MLWGTATSAYQTEGAVREDGRAPCIWDTFAERPGAIAGGESGATACDFYHRYRDDITLLADLGVDAFRFSIAWSRVIPEGRGRVNAAGLDFYDRLVDALLSAGIDPFVTLYHFDLPQALEDAGGWPERATAEAFAEYAGVVAARLGDRVRFWSTHNEPWCTSWLGYVLGVHAPGRADVAAGAAALHHVLLSHGLALAAIRAAAPAAEAGILVDSWPQHPASASRRDVEAARVADGFRNRIVFDPLLRGAYPDDVLERLGPAAPPVRDGDMAIVAAPIDFLGIHYYSRNVVRADPAGEPEEVAPAGPVSAMGWEIHPDGMHEVLTRLHREYGAPPLIVTENGVACHDVVGPDGRVDDAQRIAFLNAHLDRVARAVDEGVPVRGYFVWSLLDNFEWAAGYAKRFGLVYVDYPTLARIPKASYGWYRDLIATSRAAAAPHPAASAYTGPRGARTHAGSGPSPRSLRAGG
jgi:beta-glucosidase